MPWPALAVGTLAVAVGAAGLIRSAVPESSAAPASQSSSSAAGPIAVTNAYVHAPVAPSRNAAAYFTVYNTTAVPDRLIAVVTGAGPTAVLHKDSDNGSMAAMTDGAVIPAHGTLMLHTGEEHVMIENVYGTLALGSTVNISLTFQNAGEIDVVAPVVPLTQNKP